VAQRYGLGSMMKIRGLGDAHPVFRDGKEDKEASRRIKIKFELDYQKIVDALKSRLQ
jgi:outer membrane protein OmpA-like peptidoglycan-associated protein